MLCLHPQIDELMPSQKFPGAFASKFFLVVFVCIRISVNIEHLRVKGSMRRAGERGIEGVGITKPPS